jgi:hypothetical protein
VSRELHPLVARLRDVLASASTWGFQVILAGDFNGVFDPSQDRIPQHVGSTPDTVLMQLLVHQDLADTYRTVHSDTHSLQSMTRINPADSSSGSRIDYILASPELALRVTHSQVASVPGLATDHWLLFTSFSTGMLTKCVRCSSIRKFTKAQSVWNFKVMTQESWASFTQTSESVLELLLPGDHQKDLATSLQQTTVDSMWDVLLEVLNVAAKKTIPQCQLRGEPHPPKEEVPINHGLRLLGWLLRCITALVNHVGVIAYPTWDCLRQTYSSLLGVIPKPDMQAILLGAGFTALPALPPTLPSPSSVWQQFKKELRKL